ATALAPGRGTRARPPRNPGARVARPRADGGRGRRGGASAARPVRRRRRRERALRARQQRRRRLRAGASPARRRRPGGRLPDGGAREARRPRAPGTTTADARALRAAAAAFGVTGCEPEDADVVVDALFGSGFRGRLEGAAQALRAPADTVGGPSGALR